VEKNKKKSASSDIDKFIKKKELQNNILEKIIKEIKKNKNIK